MSLKIDRLQLEIVINNDQARKSLRALEDEAKQLKKDLRKAAEGTAEWDKLNDKLRLNKLRHDKIIEALGIEKLTIKELAMRQKELNRIMSNLDPTTAAYKKLETQLIAVKNRQAQLRGSATKTNMSLKKLAGSFNHYFGMVTAGLATITGIFFSAKEWVKGLVGLDDQVANVMKTTNLTRKEVRELHSEFKYLNTRTPRKELMLLAEQAGRLGKKSKKDVMDFVEVANQIKVALGDDLGGNAEEAIREVGKLTNIYKIGTKYGTDFRQSMLMLGSSINEVSANSQAQAPFLIETMKRLGGIAAQAGISAQNVIGYASALDQLGQRQETSSTAMSKVIINMFKDVDTYAEIALVSTEEFTNLLETDANEAFLKFLEGLNGNNAGLSVMAQKLDGLGLDGSRAVQVLAALSSSTQLVREQQDLANISLEQGTSLTNEYNIKNNNMAGNLDKIGRYLRAIFINSDIIKGVEKLVGFFADWVKIPTETKLRKEQAEINILVKSVASLNVESETRNRLFKKLKDQYPDYFKNLDADNIKNEDLFKILEKINEEYRKKIKLSVYEDQLTSNEEKAKDVFIEQEEIVTRINTLYDKYVKNKKEGASIDEQIRALREDELDATVLWKEAADDIYNTTVSAADIESIRRGNAAKAYSRFNELMDEQIELEKEYQKIFEKRAGLSPGTGGKKPSGGKTIPDDGGKIITNIITLEKELAKLKDARKLIDVNDKVALAENEKQTRLLKLQIDKLTISYKKNAKAKKIALLGPEPDPTIKEYYTEMAEYRADDLEDINKAFELETTLRKTEHQKALATLGTDHEARKRLDDKFKREEQERAVIHLEKLTALLNEQLINGGIDGLSISEAMLSEEEKEALTIRITDLQLLIAELKAELAGEEPTDGIGGVLAKYLLGEDWESMALADKIKAIGDLAVNTLRDINKIISNAEDQQMMNFKKNVSDKKTLLNKQLNDGIISYEEYTARTAQLDEDLDKKQRKIAHDQAVRAKAIAIMMAVLNTAVSITKALSSTAPPASYVLAAISAAIGAVQIGVAATEPVPAYGSGSYKQILASDGKKYRARVTNSKHKSGLYNEPTYRPGFGLFGETDDPELVFNPKDTEAIMNTPALIEAINSTIGVRQFANGNAREMITNNNTVEKTFTDPAMLTLLEKLSIKLDEPWEAFLNPNEQYLRTHKEKMGEYDSFQERVG